MPRSPEAQMPRSPDAQKPRSRDAQKPYLKYFPSSFVIELKQYSLTQSLTISDVFQNVGNQLRGFIRKRVASVDDAEDILQDVFYQLAAADQLMKPIEQVSSWLYTVARNRITDMYRKKRPEPVSSFIAGSEDDESLSEITDLLAVPDNSPDTEYLKSLVWTELEKALSELPHEQREAFEMNELQGMSFKEMARLTGETENTLISRKRYAVLHLRERLNILYEELINF
jgi:RNA polymerase sigma factor (sigma-70 family)